jgi:hypothetical protein
MSIISEAEEVPFQLLHGELVKHVLTRTGNDRVKALSDVESIGFSSGYRLVEKITREHPKFKDELELMKFVCKDYWMCIFRKQIDNLRTNHQGVYVLQDKSFKYLQSISASKQYFEDSSVFLVFTCGLLRGSLANLGIKSVVTTEVVSLPAVKFQIQVQRN